MGVGCESSSKSRSVKIAKSDDFGSADSAPALSNIYRLIERNPNGRVV